MDIRFVAESMDHQGSGSHVSLDILSRTLVHRGHDVEILTANIEQENNLTKEVPYALTSLHEAIEDPKSWRAWRAAVSKYSKHADLIHVFDPFFAPLFALYRSYGGKTPIVTRLNSYMMFCTNPTMMNGECHKSCGIRDKMRHDDVSWEKNLMKLPQYAMSSYTVPRVVNDIDKLFAQSPSIKQIYTETGMNPERIDVVSNFYDPEFTSQNSVEANDFTRDEFNILYVGRIRHIKGVDVLIDAVGRSQSQVTVDIVGDGDARKQVEEQAAELSVSDHINFHGWVDHAEIYPYFEESDVFVQPGRWAEPSGRALLEAMQCNCVPVVSNVGGPPWIVGDAGLVFDSEDPKALSRSIDEITRPDNYDQMQSKVKERLEFFNPEKIITQIESQYYDLV